MVGDPDRRQLRKVTVNKDANLQVDVTEHWHDRQDVHVKPKAVTAKGERNENGSITVHRP